MSLARTTLEELSADPEAQRLAREREDAIFLHEYFMERSRREGHEEGKAEGLRTAIAGLCEMLSLPVPDGQLEALNLAQLEQLLEHPLRERKWPKGM